MANRAKMAAGKAIAGTRSWVGRSGGLRALGINRETVVRYVGLAAR
jgi:hypothetical protein